MEIDTSLTGLGSILNQEVIYATPIFNLYRMDLNIESLEMLNRVTAFKLWAKKWAHSTKKFYCDNQVVVQVVKTSLTRDYMFALFNIYLADHYHL